MEIVNEREAVIIAGRRAGDGFVRLSVFTRELLELTVEAHGERASTLLLTRVQINELQATLARLAAHVGDAGRNAATEELTSVSWNGRERRGGADAS